MCVGNQIGIELAEDVDVESLFTPLYGSFIVELAEDAELPEVADGVVVEPLAPPSRLCHRHRLRGHRARRAPGGLGERHRGVFAYRSAGETPESRPSTSAPRISTCTAAQDRRPRVIIPRVPRQQLRVRQRPRLPCRRCRGRHLRDQQPHARGRRREHPRACPPHPCKPDRYDPRRLLGRRRARRLCQVHHAFFRAPEVTEQSATCSRPAMA